MFSLKTLIKVMIFASTLISYALMPLDELDNKTKDSALTTT